MSGALPGSCSALWDGADRPAWGTAAVAAFVLALEQPGAWGAQALTQSRLDPRLGAALDAACAGAGGRALLIRAPARRHPDPGASAPRRVLLAGGLAHDPWLIETDVVDPATLLEVPFGRLAALSASEASAWPGWRRAAASILVCTNGRRDVCCALTGRWVAEALASTHPGRVWEASHLGGHRFAPTALVLPTGAALARLTPHLAREALEAAEVGELSPSTLDQRHFRGRCCLTPPDQVADAAVRIATLERLPEALVVESVPGGAQVRHVDGRSWFVATGRERLADLPLSCGQPPEPAMVWRATLVMPSGLVTDWG